MRQKNGGEMIIEAKEASVKTAQVEVKALTISGKQVTLAVFRQLEEIECHDSDFNIDCTIWGKVNYHPDKCSSDKEHIHLIVQKEDKIFRSIVFKEIPYSFIQEIRSEIESRFTSFFLCSLQKDPSFFDIGTLSSYGNPSLRIQGHKINLLINKSHISYGYNRFFDPKLLAEKIDKFGRYTFDEVRESIENEMQKICAYSRIYEKARLTEHLFIAV